METREADAGRARAARRSSSPSSRSATIEELARAGRARPRSRSPPTRASRAAPTPERAVEAGACALAGIKLSKVGGPEEAIAIAEVLPCLPLQRPRRPGRDRRRRPGRADPRARREVPASPTASPPSASSPRRSPRSSASCGTACSIRPRVPASGSRSTRRRCRPTGSSLTGVSVPSGKRRDGPDQRQHRARLGLRRGAGPLRGAPRGALPRLALDPARGGALAPAGDRGDRDRRRALRRLLRARRRAGDRRAGGDPLHLGHRGRQLPPGDLRGRRVGGAADRADRRPPAGAARDRRRADDRPAQALRLRGALVLRGRHPRGRRRRAAPLPLDRLPGLRRRPRRAAPGPGPPQPRPGASRWRRSPIGGGRHRHRPARARGARRAAADRGDADRPRALGLPARGGRQAHRRGDRPA